MLLGLASQEHKRSLILRRQNKEVDFLAERLEEILGHKDGYNGQAKRWKLGKRPHDRLLMFGGCQHLGDEKAYKGVAKDFIGFDEASEFLEQMVTFILGWLRTPDQDQRARVMFATNPPSTVDGEWIVRWFGPWLDKKHPLYGKSGYPNGKLLYFKRRPGPGNEFDFFEEEPEPAIVHGKEVRAQTRTFIRSGLVNNPDLDRGDYRSVIAAMPEELRKTHGEGDFTMSARDDEWQLIKTDWIIAAQERWTDKPPGNVSMTSIGVDIAQGGPDRTVLAPRYDQYFCQLVSIPGELTPDGPSGAAQIVMHLRDGAQVNIDLGGGWGGSTFDHLKAIEGMKLYGFVPSAEGVGSSADGKYRFLNLRAAAYWQLRECLAPGSGYKIALPPDGELKQELAAIRYREAPGSRIQLEDKAITKKRIGRSPDKADAVMIAWYSGASNPVRSKRLQTARFGGMAAMSTNPSRGRYSRSGRNRGGNQSNGGNTPGEQG